MAILNPPREKRLRERLLKEAGTIKFLPRLASEAEALNGQPAVAALTRALREHRQVVLEGVAGSGKTVISLQLTVESAQLQCAYLEAPSWLPEDTDGLDEFLAAAACDYAKSKAALEAGTLVLILDAVDEAPWTSTGRSVPEALIRLSAEIDGRAGLLVTSRTSSQVPELRGTRARIVASLSGIDPDQVEAFLTEYSGGRGGVGDLAETLKTLPFPPQMRYSPLILRQFAEGLSTKDIPDNIVQLFERIADFHITRECAKATATSSTPAAGSWQQRYADQDRHRALVCALAFGTGKGGRVLTEEELKRVVMEVLAPATLAARATIEMSTLMSQHPLVALTYAGTSATDDTYRIDGPADWARVALFPSFLSQKLLDAQLQVLDSWHQAIPYHADFAPAWSWLERSSRTDDTLATLLDLAGTTDQARAIAAWLGAQLFSDHGPREVTAKLFSAITTLAGRFASRASDLTEELGLAALTTGPLHLQERTLRLSNINQVANFTALDLENCELRLEVDGPSSITLADCSLENVTIRIEGASECQLVRCYLRGVDVHVSAASRLVLRGCLCGLDCNFPDGTIGLESCQRLDLQVAADNAWALAEVLRRLVSVGERPELSRRKANLQESNVYKGIVSRYSDRAARIVNLMIGFGYLLRKPTGSVHRLDPTGKFDAHEAARFIASPAPAGAGPMTAQILGELRD